jgi:hypothetical protein
MATRSVDDLYALAMMSKGSHSRPAALSDCSGSAASMYLAEYQCNSAFSGVERCNSMPATSVSTDHHVTWLACFLVRKNEARSRGPRYSIQACLAGSELLAARCGAGTKEGETDKSQ